MFLAYLNQTEQFTKPTAFAWAKAFFKQFPAQNNSNVLLKWAIAFGRWPIFKMVLFFEHLFFFFKPLSLQNNFNGFWPVFGIFNF